MPENKDNVAAVHPSYIAAQEKRTVWEDVCAGTLALRAKRQRYIPKFPAETDEDYKFRCETACLFNLTAKTRDTMTGLVFKGEIEVSEDVAPEIQALTEDIDNEGTHLDVFARRAFEESFKGFSAILVDAPDLRASDLEEERALGLRPYWKLYAAASVVNWQHRVNPVSKRRELTLLVLREVTDEPAGEFLSREVVRYRSFRLAGGRVAWQLWREERRSATGEAEYLLESEGAYERLTAIPAAMVGEPGAPPPFMDIALKNLEHFQTYSDYKSLVHKTCVPIPVAKGLEMEGGADISVNGSTLIQTSADGDFGFAEVAGTSLEAVRQSLLDNREEIALMGLSLLADETARTEVTATEALLNNIGETAELRVMARQLQDALEFAAGHTAEFLGLPRTAGGSFRLGAAWNSQQDELSADLAELNVKADIVNKLTDLVPPDALLALVGIASAEEAREWQARLAAMEAPVLEDPAPEQPAPDEEDVTA